MNQPGCTPTLIKSSRNKDLLDHEEISVKSSLCEDPLDRKAILVKFIPIGHRCNSIQFLRKFKLYTHNSPFDWSILSLITFVDMINKDFDNLFNDLYNLKSKTILYNKNNISTLVQPCNYGPFIKNYLEGFMNLSYYDGDPDIYRSNCFVIAHYDMADKATLEKLEHRLNNFRTYTDKIYFYITIIHEDVSASVSHYEQILDGVKGNAQFFIVIAIDASKIADDYAIKYKQHTLYILRVPNVRKQKVARKSLAIGENDILIDTSIKWDKLCEYMKNNYQTAQSPINTDYLPKIID